MLTIAELVAKMWGLSLLAKLEVLFSVILAMFKLQIQTLDLYALSVL